MSRSHQSERGRCDGKKRDSPPKPKKRETNKEPLPYVLGASCFLFSLFDTSGGSPSCNNFYTHYLRTPHGTLQNNSKRPIKNHSP
jgi:hypothetical protein